MLGFNFSEKPKNLVPVEELQNIEKRQKVNTFDRLQRIKGKIQTRIRRKKYVLLLRDQISVGSNVNLKELLKF
jgi:hypothetical protein